MILFSEHALGRFQVLPSVRPLTVTGGIGVLPVVDAVACGLRANGIYLFSFHHQQCYIYPYNPGESPGVAVGSTHKATTMVDTGTQTTAGAVQVAVTKKLKRSHRVAIENIIHEFNEGKPLQPHQWTALAESAQVTMQYMCSDGSCDDTFVVVGTGCVRKEHVVWLWPWRARRHWVDAVCIAASYVVPPGSKIMRTSVQATTPAAHEVSTLMIVDKCREHKGDANAINNVLMGITLRRFDDSSVLACHHSVIPPLLDRDLEDLGGIGEMDIGEMDIGELDIGGVSEMGGIGELVETDSCGDLYHFLMDGLEYENINV